MDRETAWLVRAMFQDLINSQDADTRAFLQRKFEQGGWADDQEVGELWNAWQKLEGWIASHGLEYALGYDDIV